MKKITRKDLERILTEALKKGRKKKLPKPRPVEGFEEDDEGPWEPPPNYIDPDIDMNL
jgi:hypothetical protein